MAKKRVKKVRRIVMGVGHPWFYSAWSGVCDKVSIAKARNGKAMKLRLPANIGNWNKVRLIMEVLK